MNNDQNNIFNNISANNNTNEGTPVGTTNTNNQNNLQQDSSSVLNIPTAPSVTSNENATTLNSVPQNNAGTEMKINNPGPFDIGFNSENNNTQPINSNLNTIETNNTQMVNNNVAATQSNTEQPKVNNGINNNQTQMNNNVNNNFYQEDTSVVPVKKWLGLIALSIIPLVNLIVLIVKAIDKNGNKNISNYAKAQLLFSLIVSIVSIILVIVAFSLYLGMTKDIVDKAEDHINNNYNDGYDYNYGYDNNDYYYSFD